MYQVGRKNVFERALKALVVDLSCRSQNVNIKWRLLLRGASKMIDESPILQE